MSNYPRTVDANELRVTAAEPPTNVVRVHIARDAHVDLAVPAATSHPRTDLVVMRRNALLVLAGHTIAAPNGELIADDLPLAEIRRPANATSVRQSDIVDRRTWAVHRDELGDPIATEMRSHR